MQKVLNNEGYPSFLKSGIVKTALTLTKLVSSLDFSGADIADSHKVTDFETLKRKTLRI